MRLVVGGFARYMCVLVLNRRVGRRLPTAPHASPVHTRSTPHSTPGKGVLNVQSRHQARRRHHLRRSLREGNLVFDLGTVLHRPTKSTSRLCRSSQLAPIARDNYNFLSYHLSIENACSAETFFLLVCRVEWWSNTLGRYTWKEYQFGQFSDCTITNGHVT